MEEGRVRELEVDVEQEVVEEAEGVEEMEEAEETEEVMDVEVALVQEDLEALGALLVEWVVQVLQVQMPIVHGMGLGGVMAMVVAGEGEAGMEVWDLLDLTTTQPGTDPEVEAEVVAVVEEDVTDLMDRLEELAGRADKLLGLSLGMESEGGKRRGSRVGLPQVLGWSLLFALLAILLSHRQMSSQLVLLIRTSVQHSIWKTLVVGVDPLALEEGLEKAQAVVMEEQAQIMASEEEMEVEEVEEVTEGVVVMEEGVERVLLEELEVWGVLEVWAVLALMAIVLGTGLGAVTEGRLADVARAMVAQKQGRPKRRVGQERSKRRRSAAAGGQSPSG